jgi:acyl-CoA thioesterase YciA
MNDDLVDGSRREPAVRTLAMPADANPAGDIFGGWVLAQMDIAGGLAAGYRARGRVATVGLESMTFHKPIKVGDIVSCYTEVVKVGTTSIAVKVETEVVRQITAEPVTVTEGIFTYVALDEGGRPRAVDPGETSSA